MSGSAPFTESLSRYLAGRRWFAGKSETLRSTEVVESIPIQTDENPAFLLFVRVGYASGSEQTYALPLRHVSPDEKRPEAAPSTSGYLVEGGRGGVLADALENRTFALWLLRTVKEGIESAGVAGKFIGVPAGACKRLLDAPPEALDPSMLSVEQSNTSIKYGERAILKFFRRVEEGINLDDETGRFLTEKAHFEHTPLVAGSIEYRREGNPPATIALLQGFVRNRGDAWKYALDSLDEYFERAEQSGNPIPPLPVKAPSGRRLAESEPPRDARNLMGGFLSAAGLLGKRTAELHLALASGPEDPNFAPEGFSQHHRDRLLHGITGLAGEALRLLRDNIPHIEPPTREKALCAIAGWDAAFSRCRQLLERPLTAQRIRIHGDYHLGQVLFTGGDFFIIDFEGEPERPLAERRAKHSPLRDVAGMLRSFHYASCAALVRRKAQSAGAALLTGPLAQWACCWRRWVCAEFLRSYLSAADSATFLPRDETELDALLNFFLLEKAAYEVIYELRNRPDWLPIPLDGILELVEP